MVFPLVMYGCESWAIKKAEHQRIDAIEFFPVVMCFPVAIGAGEDSWKSLGQQGDQTSQS